MMKSGAFAVICLASASALAQPAADQPPPPTPTTDPSLGPTVEAPKPDDSAQQTTAQAPPPKKKEPGRGDFDAGGQARFPSGPDEMGEFASFNWVAFDLKGRYYILDQVTVDGFIPLAIIKPDTAGAMGPEPSMFGGIQTKLEAKLIKMKFMGKENEIGLNVSPGYMREGAMLLSEKDYPLFVGDMKPGIGLGLTSKINLSSLLSFSFVPQLVYQSGTMDSLTAIQIPMSLRVALGELIKVSADIGVYTGDDFSFGGADGGRIATGAALTVKLGKIVVHTGAGVASLLTGGLYPSISDSVYVDVNIKYAK